MIHLSLSHREREDLWAALLDSTKVRTKVHIHDQNEKRISSMQFSAAGSRLISGAVQMDTTGDVSRTCSMDIFDPRHRLAFTPDSPAHGAVYAGYFLSVERSIYVPNQNLYPSADTFPDTTVWPGDSSGEGEWVDVPVMWGPLTRFTSQGPVVRLECQGKEALGLAPSYCGRGYTLKGHKDRVDDAIREVMHRIGETRFELANMPWKLRHDRVVHAREEPWKVVNGGGEDSQGKKIAGLIQRTGAHPHILYYDARGRLRSKRENREPVFTFAADTIASEVEVDWDALDVPNTVDVRGAKPKGKGKKRAHARVSLPAHHPLSPESLARNDKRLGGERIEWIDAPNLKTDRECRERAHHVLKHRSEIGIAGSFDCIEIPLLEEGDRVKAETDLFNVQFPIRQMTFPLDNSLMTVGSNRKIKRHHHRHDVGGPGRAGPSGGTGSSRRHHDGRHHGGKGRDRDRRH